MDNKAVEQQHRLSEKILALGGTVPAPWPWAITKKWGKKVWVDTALRNLQLLELVEKLERKK